MLQPRIMIKRRQVAGAGDDVASVDAAQTAHESEKVVVVAFAPKSEKNAKRNLKDFIGLARDQLTVFGADLTWEAWKWDGVCQFTKRSAPPKVKDPTQYLMSKEFIDFAKAYIRYQAGQNSGTRSVSSFRMAALRAVEAALIDRKGVANPRDIDLDTLNQAASLLREQFGPRIAYPRSLKLAELAIFLAAHRLAVVNTRFWRNPIASPKNLHVGIGKEAADAREKLMPDPRALDALGSLFGQGCDVFDRRQHVDIFTTSAAAMLLGAPTRAGEELFKLRIDLEFLGPDKEGVMRYGWRTRSGKNFGWTTKWVPDVWVPVAKEAVRRLKAITEDSRQLALYIEEQMANSKVHPNAPKLFYRHSNCPSVPDDQLLSAEEVCLALGFENPKSLNQNHLSQRDGVYTLESLWKWVLDALPENFPYTDKTEQLKFSEALFCMFSYQLHSSRSASPVRLWKPELSSLGPNLYGDRSIFARHQFLDQEGLPLAIWSHQFRHYLNTLAHEGTGAEYLSPEQIDTWSGRKRRGEDYDHVPGETRAENVARTLRRPDGSYAVIELAPKRAEHLYDKPRSHWRLKLSPPRSLEE